MRRGEVWWADLPPPVDRRPVVLLSRDAAYRVRTAVTVVPVTRTLRDIPTEVPLDQKDDLPARCVVNLDDLDASEGAPHPTDCGALLRENDGCRGGDSVRPRSVVSERALRRGAGRPKPSGCDRPTGVRERRTGWETD